MVPRSAFLALLLGVLAVVFVEPELAPKPGKGTGPAVTTTFSLPPREWDFRDGRTLERVEWPADVTDDRWYIETPFALWLTMPGAKTEQVDCRSAIVFREGDQIRCLYLHFVPGSADKAFQDAITLSRQFGIEKVAPLHEWADRRRVDPDGHREYQRWVKASRAHPATQPCYVEIRPAFNPDAPWQARLCIGFDDAASPGR